MRLKFLVLSFAVIIVLSACSKKEEQNQPQTQTKVQPKVNAHQVVSQEVLQVNSYTYIRVKDGDKEYWVAGPAMDVKKGETLYFVKSMEMKNFESKELKRTFESLFFVDNISKIPPADAQDGLTATPQKPTLEKANVSVEPAAGGITISQLFSNLNSYANKTVLLKGKVVKINNGIMGKNWAHIQDGTSSGGDFDLTVTTNDALSVGDVLTFEGKISLNKDFGYGYSYKVLMEDAKSKK
ncbi:MAG: hypothetical protein CVV24_11130 [Ignavibacteriae bacterium HGW-Ignavibacteriae-3]|nr:MAG: hypothetical protein CVV24_11130 [Ignavibacteriae bacterium HGW-Ignavibacteriae-3]